MLVLNVCMHSAVVYFVLFFNLLLDLRSVFGVNGPEMGVVRKL